MCNKFIESQNIGIGFRRTENFTDVTLKMAYERSW